MKTKIYDIVISGAGIAGTILSLIFKKQGHSVMLIEVGKHPRFSLGEAMLPQSAIWPWIIGEYYNIPEIQHLAHADKIIEEITPNCGVKHSIGFVYHHSDQETRKENIHQLIPPHLPFYSESHLFREDVDLYYLQAALNNGVEYIDETQIRDIKLDAESVYITTDNGNFTGKFYIDTSGKSSLLAQIGGHRNINPKLTTQSRSIFTHLEGLLPFDQLIDSAIHPNQNRTLRHGTLHHVFDGGWIWVIPFDNHEKSTSTVASVGMMLDCEKMPADESLSPEEEFFKIIDSYPDIKKQLAGTKAIRPWIRTGRVQYDANSCTGDRYVLTNNSYGFVDALYSNGLINTFESVFYISKLVLDAFKEGNFCKTGFQQLEALQKNQLRDSDLMVANAYRAMGSLATWNAWTQLWLGQVLFHDLYLQRLCFKYFETKDIRVFDALFIDGRPGDDAPFAANKKAIIAGVQAILEKFQAGKLEPEAAEEKMLDILATQDWLPKHVYGWGKKDSRNVDFSDMNLVGALIGWGKTDAPKNIREELFDFNVPF